MGHVDLLAEWSLSTVAVAPGPVHRAKGSLIAIRDGAPNTLNLSII
jgi:hypothetical protein